MRPIIRPYFRRTLKLPFFPSCVLGKLLLSSSYIPPIMTHERTMCHMIVSTAGLPLMGTDKV